MTKASNSISENDVWEEVRRELRLKNKSGQLSPQNQKAYERASYAHELRQKMKGKSKVA